MDFDFNEDQYRFQEEFKKFLSSECPRDRIMKGFDNASLRLLWVQLTEMGLFSMLASEEYGGMGMNFIDVALLIEELGAALVPPPVVETLVCTDIISRYGSDYHKEQLLPGIADGKISVVPAFAESMRVVNPLDIRSCLIQSDGKLLLNGHKSMVPQAATADYIIFAVRDKKVDKRCLVLMEASRQGISITDHSTIDPSCHFQNITLNDVVIDSGDFIGDGERCEAVDRLFDMSSAAHAIQMCGIARRVLELAVEFSNTRVQFDKPIGSFQAIKHKCADMAVAVEGAQSAAYFAAWALAADSAERTKAVSIAKSYCSDAADMVCQEGIQVHGGMGFTWEMGLHHYLRRAKTLRFNYGDPSFHRERVFAESITHF